MVISAGKHTEPDGTSPCDEGKPRISMVISQFAIEHVHGNNKFSNLNTLILHSYVTLPESMLKQNEIIKLNPQQQVILRFDQQEMWRIYTWHIWIKLGLCWFMFTLTRIHGGYIYRWVGLFEHHRWYRIFRKMTSRVKQIPHQIQKDMTDIKRKNMTNLNGNNATLA